MVVQLILHDSRTNPNVKDDQTGISPLMLSVGRYIYRLFLNNLLIDLYDILG